MQDIVELERRITAAMDRIAAGVERQAAFAEANFAEGAGYVGQGEDDLPTMGAGHTVSAEIAQLTEALDEERMTNAQLNERLRVLREKDSLDTSDVRAELDAVKAQFASQSDEVATLRRVLAEAGKEIATLRAARSAEAAELADIVAALDPLIAEVTHA